MRLLIVRRPRGGESYAGMDRLGTSTAGGVPQELVVREVAVQSLPPEARARALRSVLRDLARLGHEEYELVALDQAPEGKWEHLGYDVGELGPRAWSAVSHAADFLSEEETAQWRLRRNEHGLFATVEDARRFLERYLAYDDPDRGWGPAGWQEDAEDYGVVPVFRAR